LIFIEIQGEIILKQKNHNKKTKYKLPTLKKGTRRAIGKQAYERLDTSPYAKSKRSHKKRLPSRLKDSIKHPCITYKEGFQFTEEYQTQYQKEILENNKKVI